MGDLRTVAAAAAVLVIGVTGCSGTDDTAQPEPIVSASATMATVSMQTTCDELFLDGQPRLWTRAVDLAAKASHDQMWRIAEANEVAASLEEIAATSQASIQPHVQQMADTVAYLDGADLSDFERSAREVANTCTPYVAADSSG